MKNQIDRGGYIEAIGRRKTASARVRISKVAKGVIVNKQPIEEYFPVSQLVQVALAPLSENEMYKELGVTVLVKGGGTTAQAEAIRHGLATALVRFNEDDRKMLKDLGFLTRDPRKKERKKPGLLKARKAPQWTKR